MWLLVGGNSEIASFTARTMRERGDEVVVTSRRGDEGPLFLDLDDGLDEWQPPPSVTSACVCAAVSKLDRCAADPIGTSRINVTQTATLVERLTRSGVHALFLSTNQVFDGTCALEPAQATRRPVSEYGRQKAEMEAILEEAMVSGAAIAVLRLAKVFAPEAQLLARWARTLACKRPVSAFADMRVAPVPALAVAEAIRSLMRDRRSGTYQLSGPRDVSYADLARLMAARLGVPEDLVLEGSAANRELAEGALPHFTTLDSSALQSQYGIVVPDVATFVDRFVEELHLDGGG